MTPTCLIWGSLISEDTLGRGESHGGGTAACCRRGTDWKPESMSQRCLARASQRPLCTLPTAVVYSMPLTSLWSQRIRTQTFRKPTAPLSPKIAPEVAFSLAPHTAPSTVCAFVTYTSCSVPEPSYVYAANCQKTRFSGS